MEFWKRFAHAEHLKFFFSNTSDNSWVHPSFASASGFVSPDALAKLGCTLEVAVIMNWFRYCLVVAALMNFTGATAFALPLITHTNPFGLPDAHPFYLGTLSLWILIFGIAYSWMALTQKPERVVIAVAAACKGAIALFFLFFWATGDIPFMTASAGLGDLGFAIAFVYWLLSKSATS